MNKYQKIAIKIAKTVHPTWMNIPDYKKITGGNFIRMKNAAYNTMKEDNYNLVSAHTLLADFRSMEQYALLDMGEVLIKEVLEEE